MNRRISLREKTSQSHTALESLIGEFRSLGDYHRYLRGMHSFRVPLEAWLSRLEWPAVFGNWRPVMIGAVLTADLGDFGLQSRAMTNDWMALTDLDGLFGTLYVLEGSVLGAKLLSKRATQLGLSESFGARHLALQAGKAESWEAFLTVLADSPLFNVDSAAHAANRTFGAAQSAFLGTMQS